MQAHDIIGSYKNRKRIGRGGKRGTYAGRGGKGQTARSGGNVDPLFEGGRASLLERMKKRRGKPSLRPKALTVRAGAVSKAFPDGGMVTRAALIAAGLVRTKDRLRPVKLVAGGDVTSALIIDGTIRVTQGAAQSLRAAGGTVEE